MKKLYWVPSLLAVVVFAAFYNWQLVPNPWRVDDLTSGKDKVCQVHGIEMVKQMVLIKYGDSASSGWLRPRVEHAGSINAFLRIEQDQFPHARSEVWGGCCISNRSPERAVIWHCHRCVDAFIRWDAGR